MKRIKNIVIIDRLNILRQGFKDMFTDISYILKKEVHTTLLSDYENLISELRIIKQRRKIDIVVFNIYTELEYRTKLRDIDLASLISRFVPDSQIILYVDQLDNRILCDLIRDVQPSCFIIKSEALQENLNAAFIAALSGNTYYSPAVQKLIDSPLSQL